MIKKEFIISHPSELNSLSTLPILRTKAIGKLKLSGSIENHPEKNTWESELNKYYYACGCNTSAKGLLIGLIGSFIWKSVQYFQGDRNLGDSILFIFITTTIFAVAGKIFGLTNAQLKLNQVVKQIQKNWKVETEPVEDNWACG